MSLHHLTTISMGYTNAVQIYQADISFILQDKILHFIYPFLDDLLVKTITTWYQRSDASYETIPDNQGICHFIWEHLLVIHHILQCLQNVGIIVSAKKSILTALDTTIVGHKCTFNSQIPHDKKVQKICNWLECQNLTQVHRFLGVCGVLWIFIQYFASIMWPLINLTHKGVSFDWGKPQQLTMALLKDAIYHSFALQWLDYKSGRQIVLAIDTSMIVARFILLQEGEDGKRYLNRLCSISLMEVKSHYSQAKLELYGLFRALQAVQIFIFGVANLTVEMDTKYVKGMINNPDLQSNTTINQWIAGILLFHLGSYTSLPTVIQVQMGCPINHHLSTTHQKRMTMRTGWTMHIPFQSRYWMTGHLHLINPHPLLGVCLTSDITVSLNLSYPPLHLTHWVAIWSFLASPRSYRKMLG